MKCIFCDIANKNMKCSLVLENDMFVAFKDINPQAKYHILVITKEHFEDFEQVPPEIMGKLSIFIKNVTKEIGINNSGYRLITNIKEDGGQEVYHIHFHILGGEPLGTILNK